MISKLITDHVEALQEELIDIRRDFHMYPELSGEEERTSGIVAEKLTELGLDVTTGVGGHGVIGLLHGKQAGRVAAWRADMDAFESDEMLDAPYKSRVPGVKHVCGHDVHTTIGLGIAEVLSSQRDKFSGTIKFIFQPAEENGTGAQAMIDDGVLENPRPEAIFGLHAAPLQAGTIGSVAGMTVPGITKFSVHYDVDLASDAELETLTQKIFDGFLSMNTITMSPEFFELFLKGDVDLSSFVYLVGNPILGEDSVKITGIHGLLRTSDEELRLQSIQKTQSMLDEILADSPIKFTVTWPDEISIPPTVNDLDLEKQMQPILSKEIGQENLLVLDFPYPFGSEDFSRYLAHVPGVFYWLGVANEAKGIPGFLHVPNFDVDEACISVGVRAMANMLVSYLDS